jgi:sugar O-acyltransferase (sialic acid O-acetyltransferase NeuD family)
MNEILVLGGGGHSKVLISVLKKVGWQVLGYVDRKDCGLVLGVGYLGGDGVLPELRRRHRHCRAALGIGKIDASSDLRLRLQVELEELGFVLPAIVSPQAAINEEVNLGAGTVVFDGVVVNSGAVTGRACILNSNSTVEHDCRLGDNVHIAPGVTLSGAVDLGDRCMVGTGANIIQGVRVAAGCVIGAGATVVKDLVEPGTYVGNPARKLR